MNARAPHGGAQVLRGRFDADPPRRAHSRAFQIWRTPVAFSGDDRLRELAHALASIELIDEPLWRRAASGDAGAAVAIAIERVWTFEIADIRRDLILSALWGCASAGDPASILVLAKLRARIDRSGPT